MHDSRPIREGRSSRSERQSQGGQSVRSDRSSRGEMPVREGRPSGYERHHSTGERHASRDTRQFPGDERHPSRNKGLPPRDERRSKGGSRGHRNSSADRDHAERRKVTGFGAEATPAVAGDPTSAAAAGQLQQLLACLLHGLLCQMFTRRPSFPSCCILSQCATFFPCQYHRWMVCALMHSKAGYALLGLNAYTGSTHKATCTSAGMQS